MVVVAVMIIGVVGVIIGVVGVMIIGVVGRIVTIPIIVGFGIDFDALLWLCPNSLR